MDSVTFFCLLFCLALHPSACRDTKDSPRKISCGFPIPYCVTYRTGERWNKNVKLENIPLGVTDYILYSGTGNEIKKNIINSNKMDVSFTLVLQDDFILISVKLLKRNTLCVDKKIVYGRAANDSETNNLAEYEEPDLLKVNFENACEVICNIGNVVDIYCESPLVYHRSDKRSRVDNNELSTKTKIPQTESSKNIYTFKAESFDNNTIVTCQTTKSFRKIKDIKTKIRVIASKTTDEYKIATFIKYSKSKVEFDCQKYLSKAKSVQVGMINTTANDITIIDRSKIKKEFIATDNGTILCCLFYTTSEKASGTQNITRQIEKKTLLLYDESIINTVYESGAVDISIIYIILVSVLAIAIMISMIIIIYKKYYLKRSNPEETMELETYSTTNGVLYADLDIQQADNRHTIPRAESPYAKVIGVLMPAGVNKKK